MSTGCLSNKFFCRIYAFLISVAILNSFVTFQFIVSHPRPQISSVIYQYNNTVPHKGVQIIPVQQWGIKYRPIRVWCCIKTILDKTQLSIIQETWGKYCDKLLFITGDNEQERIEEVRLTYTDSTVINNVIRLKLKYTGTNITKPTKDLWEKCWRTYKYLYKHYRNDFDWIITADTDAWFSAYNFKGYAQYFDPNLPWYMGHTLTHKWRSHNYVFNAGGVFGLSRGAIKTLNRIFRTREFLDGKYSNHRCTAHGHWQDDTHIGICLKSVGVFPINSLDEQHRVRWSLASHRSMQNKSLSGNEWYYMDRFEEVPERQNCCSTHPIAFHYYKNLRKRKKYFVYLDRMYTDKSKDNWSEHPVPQRPTTFLFHTSMVDEIDEYFNIAKPPKRQKVWKGVDNLWKYRDKH